MFHEKLYSKVPFQWIAVFQITALLLFKITEIAEIAPTLKFFFAAADTNRFSTEILK